MYAKVHSNLIHNCSKLETTQMFLNSEWETNYGIFIQQTTTQKKKKKLLIQSTHDFQNHYPKSKKPETKEHVQYDPFI